ncbi:hypothetical protein BDY24DRAFT_392848 [Mrakia frigida]|uniref:uncharacterized protein n=1 Tax=Mrakia frigida TaxID=29902 RepID=UPI003FCC117D
MRLISFSLLALSLFASSSLAQDETGSPTTTAETSSPTSSVSGPTFVTPQGGFGGDVGGTCSIEWTQDTTGNWTNARIDLMTGSDIFKRALVVAIDDFDATGSTTAGSHVCPSVDTFSTIYFYRMVRLNSAGGEADRTYSGRFCISSGGNCATPANAEQPTGVADGEPWGRGYLAGSKLAQWHGSNSSST